MYCGNGESRNAWTHWRSQDFGGDGDSCSTFSTVKSKVELVIFVSFRFYEVNVLRASVEVLERSHGQYLIRF